MEANANVLCVHICYIFGKIFFSEQRFKILIYANKNIFCVKIKSADPLNMAEGCRVAKIFFF